MKILVILGTKAQYIKMAPILKQMDAFNIDYRLVYTGQHSETFDLLEKAFGTRPADDVLIPNYEANTKLSFVRWAIQFWGQTFVRLRREEWKGMDICLVHGDTASTLFGAVASRLAGVKVAHVEAGLRSSRALDPFPEELIRRLVSRITHIHFTPDSLASANLASTKSSVVQTNGNTLRDALLVSLANTGAAISGIGGTGGYGVVSLHRNENLSNATDFNVLMQAVIDAARKLPLKFVLHPATRAKIEKTGWKTRLQNTPGLDLMDRTDYPDFVKLLIGGCLLMTDGGSNQEEAAMLGLPTLLLRRTTERSDGLGDTIELSHLQPEIIQRFVSEHAKREWKIREIDTTSPSKVIVQTLVERLH